MNDTGHRRPPTPYKQAEILQALPDSARESVIERTTSSRFRRREYLYRQGEAPNGLFLIESGIVRTYYTSATGEQLTIGLWSTGDLVGAPDLLSSRRALSGIALDAVTARHLSSDAFEHACMAVPEFALQVIRALSFKVRWTSMIAANVSTKDVPTRLRELLLVLGSLFAEEGEYDETCVLTRRFSARELALMVGASRQWTTHAMIELRNAGAVDLLEGGYYRLHRRRLRDGAHLRSTLAGPSSDA